MQSGVLLGNLLDSRHVKEGYVEVSQTQVLHGVCEKRVSK
jgi:hypothetical protein